MASTELAVAILWHMHQPSYVDSLTGSAAMPWVRLHALLSYYDTVRVVRDVPGARATFNLVPVLLRQLMAASRGDAEDAFLSLAKPSPADLSADQREQLVRHFFAFNHTRRFGELPRLAELWQKRTELGEPLADQAAAAFSDAELRDLQVGFHLAWSGRTLREHELVAALLQKGRGYTEGEKSDLLALQHEFLGQVLPAYREAVAEGSIEITCTPYYHPILPLLCDTGSAREARPDLTLPAASFQRPGDAWYHVRTALDEMENTFGVRPGGMWPAEGSLSEEAIRIFTREQVRWLGCDQDVLAASLPSGRIPPGRHFQPFRYGGEEAPVIFFRDKGLSDRIGFVYASWPPEQAAADMLGYLLDIRAGLPEGHYVVPIILDGENPWESYAGSGVPFLEALYQGLVEADGLRLCTYGEYLDDGEAMPPVPLDRLQAGSWIRHDFTTWIGSEEKNRGWERLHSVRNWLEEQLAAQDALCSVSLAGEEAAVSAPDPHILGPDVESDLARAWQAMAAAEGSDWFWWYGDDNPSAFADEFDAMFRKHLTNVYRHLGAEPDPILQVSLRRESGGPRWHPPRFPLEVTLDGKVTNYFEWLDAGRCAATSGGAMQRADSPVAILYFGASPTHLLLRLDPEPGKGLNGLAGRRLSLRLLSPEAAPVTLQFPSSLVSAGRLEEDDFATAPPAAPVTGAYDEIVEIGIPWTRLGLPAGQVLTFIVALVRNGETELVLPATGALELRVPRGPLDADDWLV